MLAILLISAATILVFIGTLWLVSALTKRRHKLAHEKLDESYVYRKEPHADQVTEDPARLRENTITRG